MSTFGLLNTAYSGLVAAKAALDVTGQNISNSGTTGYTRQRVDQTSIGAAGQAIGSFTNGQNIGQGVQVIGISRLNDSIADAQVRQTAGSSGYWSTVSTAASNVETSLNEPGDNGLTATLSGFWSAWGTMSTAAGSSQTAQSAAGALLGAASLLTSRIAAGYTAASSAWTSARSATASTVQQVNAAAAQVASLNGQIKAATATGASSNELLDSRDQALQTLSKLSGSSTRQNPDGTIDVTLGGRTIVSGTTSKTLVLAGATDVIGAASAPVHLEVSDSPGAVVQADGGQLAGYVATLAAANGTGTGGTYAEAAASYNAMATSLATQVNTLHEAGSTPDGTTGHDFFALSTAGPAALGLSVVPTSISGIASASGAAGTSAGGTADAISQIGVASTSPDAAWATYVAGIGTQSKNAATQSTLATQASTAATAAQTSASGVDLDEETANLVVYQHAYQAAARVLTTVDQMLDTLINQTGVVGRA